MSDLQQKTPAELMQEDLERLEDFCLLDDTYARTYFRKHPELAEFVLRIVTGIDDLVIDPNEYETQYDAKRIAGSRSLVLDVVAGDAKGRKINLEVENWNASPERGEYHVATMCIENLRQGQDFEELPEIYVIFICGKDSVGNGRAINQFSYRNDDFGMDDDDPTHESMGGRTHIIFLNGEYEDDSTDVGRLIHDLKCSKSADMFFENLAERTRYLKETNEGRKQMCKSMEEMRQESIRNTSIAIAFNLIKLGKNTHEEIAQATNLTLEEVKRLAGQQAS